MARNKLKETTFPSLNQTGESSSSDLNLGHFQKIVDHMRRGARKNSGWCSGASAPSLDTILLLWGTLSREGRVLV